MPSRRYTLNRPPRLLSFLHNLLDDESHSDIIVWTCKESSEFKLVKPNKVAELWGASNGHPGMNYEKMSRSLRYLYTNNTLEKSFGKDFRYRFVGSSSRNQESKRSSRLPTPPSSTTSSTTSSSGSSSPTPSSEDDVNQLPSLLGRLQSLVEFNAFMSKNPYLKELPIPTQIQLFDIAKTILANSYNTTSI